MGAEGTIQGSVLCGKTVMITRTGTPRVMVRQPRCDGRCGRSVIMETLTRRRSDSCACSGPFRLLRDSAGVEVIFGVAKAPVRGRGRSVDGDRYGDSMGDGEGNRFEKVATGLHRMLERVTKRV